MTVKLATVVHLAAAYERNDGIACEGWYYPLNREHVVSSDFGSVTCPTCIEEVAFQEAEAEAEAQAEVDADLIEQRREQDSAYQS